MRPSDHDDLLLPIRQLISEDLERGARAAAELPAPDIAELMHELPIAARAGIVKALPLEVQVELFDEPTLKRRRELVPFLDPKLVARIAEDMSADERADLFGNLAEDDRAVLLRRLSAEVRSELQALLAYPATSAGGIMTTEFLSLKPEATVADALELARRRASEVETVYQLYVIDRPSGLLQGAVSLRELLIADPQQLAIDAGTRDLVTASTDTDQEQVARTIAKYNLIALPVVDSGGRMVGIVTVDDVLDVLVEEQTEDVQMIGAVQPLDDPYRRITFWQMLRKRAGWLVLLFGGVLITGDALKFFDSTIGAVRSLVFFLPLIISSGGNAGSQSATLIIRGLAVGDVALRDALYILWREARMGVALGAILAVLGAARALIWGEPADVALTVGLTLLAVVALGGTLGAMLPLALQRAGLDPAVSSTPAVASLVDVLGIVVYFSIASWLLL